MTLLKKLDLAAVLFDLDGTLVDTAPDFLLCMDELCARKNTQIHDREFFRTQVSRGASAMVRSAFNFEQDNEKVPALIEEFLEIYDENICIESKIFDGLDALLSTLEDNNIPWGIITNKPSRFAEPLVAALNINNACLICPDHVENRKPHPESMDLACKKLAIKAKHCIYIGDHRRDIEAGRAANMHTIAAAFGYIDPEDPAGEWQADYYARKPEDILNIIKMHFKIGE